MIKRKFLALLLLIAISIFCFPGCRKAVSTETTVVEATVVETYHRAAWVQLVGTGKSMVAIYHSAQHKITLQYKGYKTTVNNQDLYNQYKDNIGVIVACNLITTYYDDGTSETKLEWENNND